MIRCESGLALVPIFDFIQLIIAAILKRREGGCFTWLVDTLIYTRYEKCSSFRHGVQLVAVYTKSGSSVLFGYEYNECCPLVFHAFNDVIRKHFVYLGCLELSSL